MSRSAANSENPHDAVVQCAGCGLEADERFTVAEHWAWWVNGQGDLVPHCRACTQRRFGHRTTLTDDLLASAQRHSLGQTGGNPSNVQEGGPRLLDKPTEVPESG